MNKTMAILKNGSLHIFKERYIHNEKRGVIHSNPTEEQLIDCGYKEFIIDDVILVEKEGYCITTVYKETDTQIISTQEYVKIIDEPEDVELSESEAIDNESVEESVE